MPQLSYGLNIPAFRAGMATDTGPKRDESRIAGTGNISPGSLVGPAATPSSYETDYAQAASKYHTAGTVDVINGTLADPLTPVQFTGIAMGDSSREPFIGGNFAAGDDVTVRTFGGVAVAVVAAVDVEMPVYVRIAAGGAGIGKEFRASAAAGFGLVPGYKFKSKTAGAGFAKVQIPG